MRKKTIDPRHGPVKVLSKEEIAARFPKDDKVLPPKEGKIIITKPLPSWAKKSDKPESIEITFTELLELSKASTARLTPREKQALTSFICQIRTGKELTEKQQEFLFNLIEICHLRGDIEHDMLSPEVKAERIAIRNALVALLNKKATADQVSLIFSKEILIKAKTELSLILKEVNIYDQANMLMTSDRINEDIISKMVLSNIVARLGYSHTHISMKMKDFAVPAYKLFFWAALQEVTIGDVRTSLSGFPDLLKLALQDHPKNLSIDQLFDIIDGVYPNISIKITGIATLSSVNAINAGSPGSGKGGTRH